MKKLSVVLAILMCLTLLVPCITSCEQEIGTYDVSFFRPGLSTLETDPIIRAIKNYEEKYDAEVKTSTSDWGNYITKVVTRAAAGKAFDVIFGSTSTFPYYYTKELTQPINKYVDLKNETLNMGVMDSAFKYNNSYYLASSKSFMYTGVLTWYVYYNKDMIVEAGFDTPLDLYNNGEWTYDAMAQIGKGLTLTDSQTGEVTQYGASSWWGTGFIWGNGTTMLEMDKNGQLSPNTSDNKLINGIQSFINYTTGNDAWFEISGDGVSNFTSGKTAMTCEREFVYNDFMKQKEKGKLNFEFECVPFPNGPDNKEGYNVMDADGLAIGANCVNPRAAGKFIDEYMTFIYDLAMADAELTIPEEVIDLFAKTSENAKLLSFKDSAITGASGDNSFATIVAAAIETSPKSALDEYKNVLQDVCNDLNIQPEIIPFTAIDTLTFDDGKFDMLKLYDKKAVAEVVEENAIENKSLKITFNKEIGEDAIIGDVDAIGTDPSKVTVTGWHTYEVAFDVKFMDMLGEDEYYYITMIPEGKGSIGYETFKPFDESEINNTIHLKFVFDQVRVNSDKISVVIGSKNGGTIILDNLSITEVTE